MPDARAYLYDDEYPTCVETYATLRIFSDKLDPQEITEALCIHSTETYGKGDTFASGKWQRKVNGWFYSTEKLSDSRDSRQHLDFILDALEGKCREFQQLQAEGCETSIVAYWVSVGQGGPWLMPEQMRKLGTLNLQIWWDIYFEREEI